MASTYTTDLRLEMQGSGENDSTWGTKLNTVLSLVDDAVSGLTTVSTTGGSTTLTANNSASDQSRMAMIKVTGALVSNATIVVPAVTKKYTVWNGTSGSFTLTVKTSGGSGVLVPQGNKMGVFCDATNVDYDQTAFNDDSFVIADGTDPTKKLAFQISGVTTGTTRTITVPDASDTMVTLAATQTLTNKTLTSPTMTTPVLGVASATTVTSSGGLVENTQTGTTYTLVLADAGKVVSCSNASAIVLTIPPNSSVAAVAGAVVCWRQGGAGQITFTAGAGVTIHNVNGHTKSQGQYAYGFLRQTQTIDTWELVGATGA